MTVSPTTMPPDWNAGAVAHGLIDHDVGVRSFARECPCTRQAGDAVDHSAISHCCGKGDKPLASRHGPGARAGSASQGIGISVAGTGNVA